MPEPPSAHDRGWTVRGVVPGPGGDRCAAALDAPLLQACLNGVRPVDAHPRLPISPDQLACDAAAAARLGVPAVHVHPRCVRGRETIQAHHVADAVAAIRAVAPAVEVSVPSARWVAPNPRHRIEAVTRWGRLGAAKPDVVAVNVNEQGWREICTAARAGALGLELGVWTPADALALHRAGLPDGVIRVCAEVTLADPTLALADAARILRALGPLDVPILLHGDDASAWPVWTYATEQGLDTRVGLEDMLTRPDGTPTRDNTDLIEHAQHLSRCSPVRCPEVGDEEPPPHQVGGWRSCDVLLVESWCIGECRPLH